MWISFFSLLLACGAEHPSAGDARTVRDVTELQRIRVERAARPRDSAEVQALIQSYDGPLSMGGGRFSMGGQIASEDTLHLDLRELDDVLELDLDNQRITVEAGITWRKIQEAIDEHDLSVQIMQSYANFTVGGTLSVNAHGRYVNKGPVVHSVQSIEVVLADGSLVRASRDERPELFFGAIGGYGALGVITSATLKLDANEALKRQVEFMPMSQYKTWFDLNIRGSKDAVFHNADLYTTDYQDVVAITYVRTTDPLTVTERLQPGGESGLVDTTLYWGVSELPGGLAFRQDWYDPWRLADPQVLNRNYEASYDVAGLEPFSRLKTTYVLQEYFVPVDQLDVFTPKMAVIFERYGANILNVSLRHASADPDTLLSWAPVESYAYVVYYKQGTDSMSRLEVGLWTREMVDALNEVGGTYYLPYQPHPTTEQFHRSYPRAKELLALKGLLDPEYRFRGRLWDIYAPPPPVVDHSISLAEQLRDQEGYFRPEDQTFLTLPEWVIVYAADELGAYLTAGGSPSAFPYRASVSQFLDMYAVVSDIIDGRYPHNGGYHRMIGVIGASYAVEYGVKWAWEGSIGRFTEWVGGVGTPEDAFYATYTTDYGAFIHHTPWYAFDYVGRRADLNSMPWNFSVRGVERRVALWCELTAKAWWGWAMGAASGATYGAETNTMYAVADLSNADVSGLADVTVERELEGGLTLLSIPRYEPFTSAIPALVEAGAELVEIAGNGTVLITLIADSSWDESRLWATDVGRWPVLTIPGKDRVAVEMAVHRLDEDLPRLLGDPTVELEHIYDY
jgi:FAD/FMN-containing dehydrogenase